MHDPELDLHLEHCRQLLKCWQRFHLFLGECAKHDRAFSAQEEAQFLKLKSQIAILFDSFFESLEDPNRETIATAQSIITVVENCILLRQVQRMSAPERKKMELEWHEAYLLINSAIGNLEEEQANLAKISPAKHRQEVIVHRVKISVKAFLKDKRVHNVTIALAVIVALIVLPKMGVYDYSFLKGWAVTEKVYTGGKSFLRKYIMRDLPFDDWEEYNAIYPADKGPPGVNARERQGSVASELQLLVTLLTKDTPGADDDNIQRKQTQRFNAAGKDATMVFLLMSKTPYARAVARQAENLQAKGVSDEILKRIHVASYANMVIIVSAADETLLDQFKDYCIPPIKKVQK